TVRSEDSNHPKENMYDYRNLNKDLRAEDATKNDWLWKADFGAAQAMAALFLNYINFDKVTIQGHATDSWGTPSFEETFEISQDDRVQRYKAYCALTNFNYRWQRGFIPSDATLVGDLAVWAVSSVAALESVITLSPQITYGYDYSTDVPVKDSPKKSGGKERVGQGEDLIWTGEIPIGRRTPTDESQLWSLNALNRAEPHVLFENEGNTQYAYLCWREDPVRLTREA
ncbi:unnamed protein product, partial [marine sediment metagenome]